MSTPAQKPRPSAREHDARATSSSPAEPLSGRRARASRAVERVDGRDGRARPRRCRPSTCAPSIAAHHCSLTRSPEAPQRGLGLCHDALDELGAGRPVVDHAGDRAARQEAVHGVALHASRACASIGAFAAISICERVRRSFLRIASAERSSSRDRRAGRAPERQRVAERAAQVRRSCAELRAGRRARCAPRAAAGRRSRASRARRRRRPRGSDRAVDLAAPGSPAVSRKRVPIATPAAPNASAATSPRPSWKPPAPTTGMSTASTRPAGAGATSAPSPCGRRLRRLAR